MQTTISSIRSNRSSSSKSILFNSPALNQKSPYATKVAAVRLNSRTPVKTVTEKKKEFNPIASTSKWNPFFAVPPLIARAREEAANRRNTLVRKGEGSKKDGIFSRNSIGEKKIKITYEVKDNRGAASWSISGRNGKGKNREEDEADMIEDIPNLYVQELLRVPKTEKELVDALVILRTLEPRVSARKLFSIHSHSNLRPLVSKRTYTYLLTHAYKDSNLRLAREILDEMEKRGIERDETISRILLSSNLVRGDPIGVGKVLQGIKERNIVALPILNWRRDLGVEGKGQGDEFKVWNKKIEISKESSSDEVRTANKAATKSGWKSSSFSNVPRQLSVLDTKLAKQPSRIPDNFENLSSHDIRALIEDLVQDQRASESFLTSQCWLDVNRPSLLPPPSDFLTRTPPTNLASTSTTRAPPVRPNSTRPPHRQLRLRPAPLFVLPHVRPDFTTEQLNYRAAQTSHHEVALTLLNILIKSLLSTGSTPSTCKTFVTAFTSRNSFPDLTLSPNEITLIELLGGYDKVAHSWALSMRMVNWFAVTFGFRVRLASGRYARRRFLSGATRRRRSIAPQHNITPAIGRLLLRYAIEDFKSKFLDKELKKRVEKWWKGTQKIDLGWRTEETAKIVKRAIEVGLLEKEVVKGPSSRK